MKHLRLFWKVYLHGVGIMLLVVLSFVTVREIVTGDSGWRDLHLRLATHLADHAAPLIVDPPALSREIHHLREILGVDLTFYDRHNGLIATNVDPPLAPLDLDALKAGGSFCTMPLDWHVIAPIMREGAI